MTKFFLPPPALDQHCAVLGKTGGGKTITAKAIIEHIDSTKDTVCVLDPIKSDWWGMTLAADGKSPGLPFHILGGPYGHVPLHASAGAALGQIVGSGAMPLSIIDMADFGPGDSNKFFITFAESLFKSKKSESGVCYVVLEECHVFCPKEREGVKDENMAIFWMKRLASAARSKGIRLIVVTQRTQALHNAVLGSCDTIIAHRLTLPADKTPVINWCKGHVGPEKAKEIEQTLGKLQQGEAWLCSGEAEITERITVPMIRTYDNSATPTGKSRRAGPTPPPVDQDKLRSIIGEAVKEAEANDPKLLRAKIAELQRKVDAKPKPEADPAAIERAVNSAVQQRDREWERAIAERDSIIGGLKGRLGKIHELAHVNGEAVPGLILPPAQRISPRAPKTPEKQWVAGGLKSASTPQNLQPVKPRTEYTRNDTGTLPKGERIILTAVAQYPAGCSRDQLSVLTGYKRSSRDTYLQRLREKGLIQDGTMITPTSEGMAALGPDFEPLPTGDELRDYWLQRLPEGERRCLEVLIEHHPNTVERSSLDEATGYKRSSRDTYLQRLRSRKLVIDEGRGEVRASDELFG